MGLENRIVYNLVDVVEGNCRIKQALIRDWIDRISTTAPCSACGGARLGEKARASKINQLGIADMTALQVTDLLAQLERLDILLSLFSSSLPLALTAQAVFIRR